MRKRRRSSQSPVPTASMGDIAFLLIIFFIICSSFTQNASHSVKLALSPELDTVEESQIGVTVDKRGVIFLKLQEMSDPKTLEDELSKLLEKRKDPKQRAVMFNCDRTLTKKQYEPVIAAIAKAGGLMTAMGEKKDDKPSKTGD